MPTLADMTAEEQSQAEAELVAYLVGTEQGHLDHLRAVAEDLTDPDLRVRRLRVLDQVQAEREAPQ